MVIPGRCLLDAAWPARSADKRGKADAVDRRVGFHMPRALCPPHGSWGKLDDAQTPLALCALGEASLLWIKRSFVALFQVRKKLCVPDQRSSLSRQPALHLVISPAQTRISFLHDVEGLRDTQPVGNLPRGFVVAACPYALTLGMLTHIRTLCSVERAPRRQSVSRPT